MKGADGMTAKEYLSELQFMKTRIGQLQEQKQMFLEMATSITAPVNPVKVQTTPKVDRMADAVAKMADIEKHIDEEVAAYYEHECQVMQQIQALHKVKYVQMLFKVYVQNKSIYVAAKEIDISYTYAIEIHKKALAEFEKVHADMLNERKAG
ncbi:hypothetical protein D3Z36_11905 [Lachnospiraceae bacterium]|nr:hypothetical protein [Lachnospiraceae bacterium]